MATVSFGSALTQLFRDSPRVIRTMSVNAAVPLLASYSDVRPPLRSGFHHKERFQLGTLPRATLPRVCLKLSKCTRVRDRQSAVRWGTEPPHGCRRSHRACMSVDGVTVRAWVSMESPCMGVDEVTVRASVSTESPCVHGCRRSLRAWSLRRSDSKRMARHEHATLRAVQVQNMHVHLYRQLWLSAEDKGRMADVWLAWERRRRALDRPHAAALDLLCRLPGPATLPAPLIRCVTACAGEDGALPQHAQHGGGAHQHRAAHAAVESCVPASGMHRAGASAVACGPPQAAPNCGQPFACAGLLGECAVATGAAAHAMRELTAVHVADGDLNADMVDLQIQPGRILSMQTMQRQWCAHLVHEVGPADFMTLCQLAATQRSRAQAFQMPVFQSECMHESHAPVMSL